MKKKYNKYASMIERRTKKNIAKNKLKAASETEQNPMSEDLDFHSIESGGFCLLNLNKKRRNGEIYKNYEFNKSLRRKFNFTQKQMDTLKEGYDAFSSQFKTRKAMLKYFRKIRKEELPLKKLQKEEQNGSTRSESMVGEKTTTPTIIEATNPIN